MSENSKNMSFGLKFGALPNFSIYKKEILRINLNFDVSYLTESYNNKIKGPHEFLAKNLP